jgi:hypothetical protein
MMCSTLVVSCLPQCPLLCRNSELRGMFENQARDERYNISKALFTCKLAEGRLVSPHVIKMMDYIET